MIKRYCIKKMVVATFALILICIISIFPKDNFDFNIEIEKINETNSVVYLLDEDNYVSKLSVFIGKDEVKDIVKEKLILLRDGSEDYTCFIPVIPKDTIINSINVEESRVYIDFSKEFLSVKSSMATSMLEAIVYSLTDINGINEVYISIDKVPLDKFPNSDVVIKQPLTRNIGINKEYDIDTLNDITKTTIYFVKENDEAKYYVPVTKINNEKREKISIIIEELKSSVYSMDNLKSYVSNNLDIEEYSEDNNIFDAVFNDYIFESIGSNTILEEVKYVIAESIIENYGVKEVIFSTKNAHNIDRYIEND